MLKKTSFALLATMSMVFASDQMNPWKNFDLECSKKILRELKPEDILNVSLTSKQHLAIVYTMSTRVMNMSNVTDIPRFFQGRTLPLPVHMIGGASLKKYAQESRTITMDRFVQILENHPYLQSIVWQDRHFYEGCSPNDLVTLQTICPNLKQLTSVTLGYERNLTDHAKTIESITKGLVTLPNLQNLTLYMRPTAGRVIIDHLDQMSKLRSLTLNNNVRELDQEMGPEHALLLKEKLKNNTTLQSLDLSINNFGDTGAQHIGEMLQHNKGLTQLSLRRNRITDAGVPHIINGLKTNSTLKSLDLLGNRIMAPATHEAALKQLPFLETYKVSENPVGGCAQQ